MVETTIAPPVMGLGFCGFYFDLNGISHLYDYAPSFDEWQQAGIELRQIERHVQFWIGDWVNYGRERWPDQADQGIATDAEIVAAEATGWKPETIDQYARVARQVPPANRHPDLTFSHHREVADRPVMDQKPWLDKAKAENWTTDKLRIELKRTTAPQDQTCWLVVRCSDPDDRDALASRLRVEGREVKQP
jgi:hypothetical protein